MKKATATSHGTRRREACDGPDNGGRTTCEAIEFMSGKLRANFEQIIRGFPAVIEIAPRCLCRRDGK
jgi:hypothetical protein